MKLIQVLDKASFTPVYAAAYEGNAKKIKALKASGADINMPNNNGETSVFIAAKNWHTAAISVLHALGANMNKLNKNRKTPLYVAAEHGNTTVATVLLQAGADASIKVSGWWRWSNTPLTIARKNRKQKHKEIVKILEEHFKQYPSRIKPQTAKFSHTNRNNNICSRLTNLIGSFQTNVNIAVMVVAAALYQTQGDYAAAERINTIHVCSDNEFRPDGATGIHVKKFCIFDE